MNSQERKAYAKAYYEATKEQYKAYYEANKEEIKASKKAYYEANKEEIKASKKAYAQAHKEQRKAYYEANKEQRKAYYEAHKEYINAYVKAYKQAHKDQVKAYMKSDVNSKGQTKQSIRMKSQRILKQMNLHIDGYEIHHCFGYEDPSKFIYCSREMHRTIHQYLRDNNISANSDHWMAIRDIVNSADEFMYIKC